MQPNPDDYEVRFAPRAQRDLDALRADVALALYLHATGPIAAEPYRCGGPLRGRYEGCLSARRGEYRLVYRVNAEEHVVQIIRLGHRRDVYGGG